MTQVYGRMSFVPKGGSAGKRVKTEPPVLDAPTGLRCPRKLLGERQGLVRTYCGPWVAMAVTGRPYPEIKAAFNSGRGRNVGHVLRGTSTGEVRRVLRSYGWEAEPIPNTALREWDSQTRKPVSFAAALRGRTAEQMKETWLVAAGDHWMLVHGKKVTCAILQRWTWVRHAKKRRAAVVTLLRLRKKDDQTALITREMTKAKNKTLVTFHERAQKASRRQSSIQSRFRKLALAEITRLGCSHEAEGRGRTSR